MDVVVGSVTTSKLVVVDLMVVVFVASSGLIVKTTVDLTVEVLSVGVTVMKAVVNEVETTSMVVVTVGVETDTTVKELAVVDAALVTATLEAAAVVVVEAVPGTKGVPSTWLKSIQDVLAKKLAISN